MFENFERKAKKAEESLAKRFIIPKKPINGYKKYYHQLQWDKYEPHLVKRIKAWALKIINYERPYYDRREISHHEMKKLALEIKKMSQIQRLELTSPEYYESTNEGLNPFFETIRKLTGLKSLKLVFRENWSESLIGTDFAVRKLCHTLKALRNLQNLNLRFFGPGISDFGIEDLGKGLRFLASLRNLTLNFCGCGEITDAGIENFSKSLAKLTSLRSLWLEFWECGYCRFDTLTNAGLIHIFKALKKLQALESLVLDFRGCEEICLEEFSSLAEAFRVLTSLKNINIKFWDKTISYKGMESLGKALKILAPETNISLTSKSSFSSEGEQFEKLHEVSQSLEKITCLKSACFDFENECGYHGNDLFNQPTIADHVIQSFSHALEKLVLLKTLNLNWKDCLISPLQLTYLGRYLKKLKSLETLNLHLDFLKTYHNLRDLGKNLLKLKSLKNLVLDLSLVERGHNSGTVNDGWGWEQIDLLASLGEILAPMTHLQTLRLELPPLAYLEVSYMVHLAESFQKLVQLQSLSLSFSSQGTPFCVSKGVCYDFAIFELCKGLMALTSLKDLTLKFNMRSSKSQITDEGIEKLGRTLLRMNSLKRIELEFQGCPEITDRGELKLMQMLKSIQNCQVKCLIDRPKPFYKEIFEERESEEPGEGYLSRCHELLNELSFVQKEELLYKEY